MGKKIKQEKEFLSSTEKEQMRVLTISNSVSGKAFLVS